MPYKSINDDKLPDHVKEMSPAMREHWVGAFNGIYDDCQADDGDDCEGKAMRGANAAVKQDTEMQGADFQFLELQIDSVMADKPFDGLAFGSFTDMFGREISLKKEDAEAYVANTKELLRATRTESGELVGLPIDANGHDKGDGAGWIVDVSFDGERIRLTPKWTEIGRELISKGIRRFFSPTVDWANKSIVGGTLTNWPASKDKKGKILLRPIELSRGFYGLESADMSEPENVIEPVDETGMETAEPEPANVDPQPEPAGNGDDNMTVELSELSEEQRAQLLEEAKKNVLADLSPDESGTADDAIERLRKELNLSAFADVADLGKAREAMLSQMQAALKAEYERMQANSGKMLAEMMAQIKRDQHIAELSQKWTGGTDNHPHGFPVGREEMEAFLGSLNQGQRKGAESIFGRIFEQGLIPFSELGHSKQQKGTIPLPDDIVNDLRTGELTLADLSNPIIAPALGDLDQYDLSEWRKNND